jgi:hypothetical protein
MGSLSMSRGGHAVRDSNGIWLPACSASSLLFVLLDIVWYALLLLYACYQQHVPTVYVNKCWLMVALVSVSLISQYGKARAYRLTASVPVCRHVLVACSLISVSSTER